MDTKKSPKALEKITLQYFEAVPYGKDAYALQFRKTGDLAFGSIVPAEHVEPVIQFAELAYERALNDFKDECEKSLPKVFELGLQRVKNNLTR